MSSQAKISVVIQLKNETKKSVTLVYDDYSTVGGVEQVLRVCGNNEAFTDADSIPGKSWSEDLMVEFSNDIVGDGRGMIQ